MGTGRGLDDGYGVGWMGKMKDWGEKHFNVRDIFD